MDAKDVFIAILAAVGGTTGVINLAPRVVAWLSRRKHRAELDQLEHKKLVLEADRLEFTEAEAVYARISKEQGLLLEALRDQVTDLQRRLQDADARSDGQDKRSNDREHAMELKVDELRKDLRKCRDDHDKAVEENRQVMHELANVRQVMRVDRERLRELLKLNPSELSNDTPNVPTELRASLVSTLIIDKDVP